MQINYKLNSKPLRPIRQYEKVIGMIIWTGIQPSLQNVITKSDSLFHYKVRQLVITKCDSYFITKYDKCYYKVRQVLQSATVLLQSATGITKCDGYYKVPQNRDSILIYDWLISLLTPHWNLFCS